MSDLATNKILRILSYNLQVGIKTSRASQYITGSWKHLIPHTQRLSNLDNTLPFLEKYDIVGLQETDAGSLRSIILISQNILQIVRSSHIGIIKLIVTLVISQNTAMVC